MQHSGTHWLKFMLSCALAHQLELPPPQFIHNDSSNDFIGHPRHARRYPQAPRIASSHSVPHALFDSRLLRLVLRFPPYAILVRDLRAALVSNYEKWKERYGVPFSEYLRGDPAGKRYIFDIWGGLHFLNRWARVRRRYPAILVLRYEELRRHPAEEVGRVFAHFGIDMAPVHIAHAVAASGKGQMAARLDPRASVRNIVREDPRPPASWFNAEDRLFFDRALAACLDDDFGYAYTWPAGTSC